MGERFGGRLLAVVGLLGVVAIGPAATPAGAVTCPAVDATTRAVTPAPSDGVDWSGCDLRHADLVDAHLAGANLHGAKLADVDARGADLADADLGAAGLTTADLRGADLSGADLTGATGSSSRLLEADLSGATLTGSVLTGVAFRGWLGTGVVGTPAAAGPCAVTEGSLLCGVGRLRATTSPPLPATIVVDGQLTDLWGLEWVKKPVGSHTVCFGDVEGYQKPACQDVEVTAGATATVTGTYVANGFLKVTTSPAVASQISVDGIPRDNWGIYTDLPTGSHEVCFGAVAGYLPPPCQTVALSAGTTTEVTGTFTASAGAPGLSGVGRLRVTTSPATPSQISVDGVPADTWGLDWLEIAPGTHTVCFRRVAGAVSSCRTVTVTAGQITTTSGFFGEWAYFKAETVPPLPASIYLNGVVIDDWGAYTVRNVAADDPWYVCFSVVPGYVTPPCQFPGITAGLATVTATYVPKP